MSDTAIALCLVCAAISAYIAYKRGGNPVIWFVAGAFLTVFAIPAAFLAGPPTKCPECRKRVDPQARKCPYCQSEIVPTFKA